MPVHVEEMTSEVAIVDGDLPLTPAQVETLVTLVVRRLEEMRRDAERSGEATKLRTGAAPRLSIDR